MKKRTWGEKRRKTKRKELKMIRKKIIAELVKRKRFINRCVIKRKIGKEKQDKRKLRREGRNKERQNGASEETKQTRK